jgi:Recombination endonuclease VII
MARGKRNGTGSCSRRHCHEPKREGYQECDGHLAERVAAAGRHLGRAVRNSPKYGISAADYLDLLRVQNEKCAICRKPGDLVIDHDHETGAVRGLLCARCNSGLGFFADAPDRLANAIVYLRRPPADWD